jgi:hypothetical protein
MPRRVSGREQSLRAWRSRIKRIGSLVVVMTVHDPILGTA